MGLRFGWLQKQMWLWKTSIVEDFEWRIETDSLRYKHTKLYIRLILLWKVKINISASLFDQFKPMKLGLWPYGKFHWFSIKKMDYKEFMTRFNNYFFIELKKKWSSIEQDHLANARLGIIGNYSILRLYLYSHDMSAY